MQYINLLRVISDLVYVLIKGGIAMRPARDTRKTEHKHVSATVEAYPRLRN